MGFLWRVVARWGWMMGLGVGLESTSYACWLRGGHYWEVREMLGIGRTTKLKMLFRVDTVCSCQGLKRKVPMEGHAEMIMRSGVICLGAPNSIQMI